MAWRSTYLILFAIALFLSFEVRSAPNVVHSAANESVQASLLTALTQHNVPVLLVVCFCFTSAFYGVFAFLADQVRQASATSASAASAIIFAFGVGFAAGTAASWLVDKIGARRLLPAALFINAAVYGLMAIAGRDYAAALAIVTLWGATTNVSLNMIVLLLSQSSSTAKGRILGLNSATTYLGATFGVTVAGIFYESSGFETVLLCAILLQVCGAMLFLGRHIADGKGAVANCNAIDNVGA
ncbi:MFS transporter [Mesorhizobium sp.]|uniref:MFS transporter n=1 Tax=Mesorhizobium sp. TaxID=1871066 RepID=UPI0025F01723|nr:MFS transporter [Mesorhizobium sp.]